MINLWRGVIDLFKIEKIYYFMKFLFPKIFKFPVFHHSRLSSIDEIT